MYTGVLWIYSILCRKRAQLDVYFVYQISELGVLLNVQFLIIAKRSNTFWEYTHWNHFMDKKTLTKKYSYGNGKNSMKYSVKVKKKL